MAVREKSARADPFCIFALTICANFDDYLTWSLPQNIRHFDNFTIVTTQADVETQKIAHHYGASIVLTDRLHEKGSQFDRGAAINDGLEQLQQRYAGDWFCIVDADMILPWNLREVLEKQPLDPDCIYGIVRGLPSDEPISGFFQLFHSSQRKRYQEGHHNAGYTDTWFRDLWAPEQQITLPDLKAEHLSRHGENWSGRVSERLDPPKQIITPDTPAEKVRQLLCGPERHPLPRDWRSWPNVQEAYRQAMASAVAKMPDYPAGKYKGRGIVLVGGGKYFASAYVTLRMIRHVGGKLPVEVWFLGRKNEMQDWQAKLLTDLGAVRVDADAMASKRPVRILNGWELKTFAVVHSRFEEILYLDADSYPCRNPEFLFDDVFFQKHGAMFFPDASWMKLVPETWKIMGIPYRDERTIESGQFLINKRVSWRPLTLTHWMNQRSDYYYHIGPRTSGQHGEHYGRGVHGDKDTFHFAWRYLNREYAMPAKDYEWIPPAVVQHAPDRKPVFIHRARRKFAIGDEAFNTSAQEGPEYEPKLPMEDLAHKFLAELKQLAPSR